MSAVDDKSNQDSRRGGGRRGNTQSDRSAGQQRQVSNQNQSQNLTRDTTNIQNRKTGKNGPSAVQNNKVVDAASVGPTSPAPDTHIPLHGFNSTDVDSLLKKAVDSKIPVYKPEAQTQQAKAQSPWGAKPGSMANGRDFFLELRKQVTTLQQSGGISQGG